MEQSRREFVINASTLSTGVALGPRHFSDFPISKGKTYPLCIFTKCLQFLDYVQLGETLANLGFKGAELAVRDEGHVLPENVKSDLPRVIKILKNSGISIPLMVTDIVDPDDPFTERILGTASELGISYYRMGYLHYDSAKTIIDNLTGYKKTFDKLEKINRKFGIQGCYHNHSGTQIGSPVWDIYWLMNGFNPEYIGVQYDIRHAVCEGGVSWPLGMRLLSPWIKTTVIKDFYWQKETGNWKITMAPLGEGMVDFDAYLKEYIRLGLTGPITVHYEYNLGGAESGSADPPSMSLTKISEFMKADLNWVKNKFEEYGM